MFIIAYDVFRQLESGPIDPIPLTEDSPLRDRLYPFRGLIDGVRRLRQETPISAALQASARPWGRPRSLLSNLVGNAFVQVYKGNHFPLSPRCDLRDPN